jgi:hypothetical protein
MGEVSMCVFIEGSHTLKKSIRRDVEKERYWQQVIREATRSGLSISEFCRQRKLRESQFYWWRRKLKDQRQKQTLRGKSKSKAKTGDQKTFALVSDNPGDLDAGIELVLSDGRRIRIGQGVDEETLRTVLSAVGSEC